MGFIAKLKRRARFLKADTLALYWAARDPRTPLVAKLVVAVVVAYAFSPIDLIPDFVPLLGYLDDLILVPLGIALAIRLVPANVMADARRRAEATLQRGKMVSKVAGAVIIVIWLLVAAWCVRWGLDQFNPQ